MIPIVYLCSLLCHRRFFVRRSLQSLIFGRVNVRQMVNYGCVFVTCKLSGMRADLLYEHFSIGFVRWVSSCFLRGIRLLGLFMRNFKTVREQSRSRTVCLAFYYVFA